MENKLIDGVRTKDLKVISDERGWLMEILRNDDEIFEKLGQIYISTVYPSVTKAWHSHKGISGNFVCVSGNIHIVIYDARKDSPTYGKINEFFIGEKNPKLLHVPNGVFYGFKCVGEKTAYLLNVADIAWDPNNSDKVRLPANSEKIPYKWVLDPTKKNM